MRSSPAVPLSVVALLVGAMSGGVSATAGVSSAAPVRLLALGDSYSSGEGNPPFNADAWACHRSVAHAWPRLVADRLPGVRLLSDVACSGAPIDAFQHPFKGQPAQRSDLVRLKPNVVTLTFGGNDAGFSSVLAHCYLSNCDLDGTVTSTARSISALTPRLVALYRTVKASLKGLRVIVVGYPSIFSGTARSQCVWLSPRERAGLYQLTSRLDTVERQAAATAGVEYVSTLQALAGHELCTNDSWVFPISFECITNTECAHPLLPGQNAIAGSVSRHLRH